jgi:LacI family transcriptional regulator
MDQRERIWSDRAHVTLTDVAFAAGVSQSAASVVLNGARSGTRISSEKRLLVMETAQKLGYRPNDLARSLSTGSTSRIGVCSGNSRLDPRNTFVAELLSGIMEEASEFGLNTMVHTSGHGEHHLLDLMSSRALDGLIIHARIDAQIVPMLGELRIPAVAVADAFESLPSVVIDDEKGGEFQAHHLASMGHRRVLLKQASIPFPSAIRRAASFKAAAARLGLEVVEGFELPKNEGPLSIAEIRMIAEGPDRVTAIVAWNDGVAEQVCIKLSELGIKIPEFVAVVGFDGLPKSFLPLFNITTIRAPWYQVGRTAVQVLRSLIERKPVPAVTTLPVDFQRGSTT